MKKKFSILAAVILAALFTSCVSTPNSNEVGVTLNKINMKLMNAGQIQVVPVYSHKFSVLSAGQITRISSTVSDLFQKAYPKSTVVKAPLLSQRSTELNIFKYPAHSGDFTIFLEFSDERDSSTPPQEILQFAIWIRDNNANVFVGPNGEFTKPAFSNKGNTWSRTGQFTPSSGPYRSPDVYTYFEKNILKTTEDFIKRLSGS